MQRIVDDDPLTVLLGRHRYRVDRPWGRLPDRLEFAGLSQVAIDSADRVYAFQRTDPPILVFAPDGEFLNAWGDGQIADAHGIFIASDDRIFLVDRDAHQILIFSPDGDRSGAIGQRHQPQFQAPFNHPTDVAVAADGDIYVADGYGNSCVHRFSPNGTHIASWGHAGTGPGEFTTPHAIWVDRSDRVLVADRENNRLQLFDRGGTFLGLWTDFYHPMDITEDIDGSILVTDQIPRLSLVGENGGLLGRCRGVWNGAHGVGRNGRGDIFLAEIQPARITKLTRLQQSDG